jgi:Mn2+/Fe2+ NRAMP family transporter
MSTPSSEPQAAADLTSSQVSGNTTNISTSPTQDGPTNDTSRPSALQRLREWLDRLLVADVFLVLAGALWFAVAVVLHSQGVEAPLASFQKLWEPLFTPAIGLLMAAALLSGALGWWQRRGQR